jgi:hypothetical protein
LANGGRYNIQFDGLKQGDVNEPHYLLLVQRKVMGPSC